MTERPATRKHKEKNTVNLETPFESDISLVSRSAMALERIFTDPTINGTGKASNPINKPINRRSSSLSLIPFRKPYGKAEMTTNPQEEISHFSEIL